MSAGGPCVIRHLEWIGLGEEGAMDYIPYLLMVQRTFGSITVSHSCGGLIYPQRGAFKQRGLK